MRAEKLIRPALTLATLLAAGLFLTATSTDGLELFFTRLDPGDSGAQPAIYRAYRIFPRDPFGPPQRVAAIQGFAEAPALSPDGRSLYYHALEDGRFVIERVTR